MKNGTIVILFCAVALSLSSCTSQRIAPQDAAAADPYQGSAAPASRFVWPEGKRAAVSLTFDDARPSQLDVGIPILNAYGTKATFYVSTRRLQQRLPDWKEVLAAGHEIGNHSLRHGCSGNFLWSRDKALEDYTLAQMAAELDEASREIERALNVQPVSFAYPCGQKYVGRGIAVRSYVPLVAERFLTGRGWMDEAANDPAFCDPAQLMAMELDGLTFEQLKTLVDQAAENGLWLVVCGHEVSTGGHQTTRADTLRAFCEYAQDPENGLWVDTVGNIARYVVEHRTIGQ